jgi:hypothetical protein
MQLYHLRLPLLQPGCNFETWYSMVRQMLEDIFGWDSLESEFFSRVKP